MTYAIEHNSTAYGPDGVIPGLEHVEDYNKKLEARELAWLQTHPDKICLYVVHPTKQFNGPGMCGPIDPDYSWKLTTWLGTVVCPHVFMGAKQRIGFGGSYRRALTATICGTLYHGWYMESSGDYCRLRKAKRQTK